ncbi:DUF6578 domain-containing protein [Streptomyces sp. NPDC041068]|uniref:DUF6578 domain-containing protein n=1 Tax=Streptomyces sp. NPDC041068 TaxID=3155130 RepID=UPI0033ECDED1
MTLWNVMYQDWQMECCGEPFGVGDEVAWQLLVDEAVCGDAAWTGELAEISGAVESAGGGPVVRTGGVTVPWTGGGRSWPPRAVLTGLLSVERHGGKWPRTVGRVRTVHVVSQGFADGLPVAGERWLRGVPACPKWFEWGEPDGRGYRRDETGVLVSLEVD